MDGPIETVDSDREGDAEFERLLSSATAFRQRIANRPGDLLTGCPQPPQNPPLPKSSTNVLVQPPRSPTPPPAPPRLPRSPRSPTPPPAPPRLPRSPTPPPAPPRLEPPITCTKCERAFASLPALMLHQMATEHNYCRPCYSFFPDKESVDQHRGLTHNFRCVDCASFFDLAPYLQEHQRKTGHAYCKHCDAYFLKKDSFQKHMANIHGANCTCPKPDDKSGPDAGAN